MKLARILVAEKSEKLLTVSAALAGYELLKAATLQQAKNLVLEDGIDLFVIGIHFDDSQAMELIKLIRGAPKYKSTPIVVLCLTASGMGSVLRQTMDVMKAIHTINDYLELDSEPKAAQRIRLTVDKCLLPTKLVANKS
jgi:DNA-binding response OmpR family regulator